MGANKPLLPAPDLATHLFTGFSGSVPLLLSKAMEESHFFKTFCLLLAGKSLHPQEF